MWRLSSASVIAIAILGSAVTIASGFSVPQLSTTAATRQQSPRSTLFPVPHTTAASTSRWPNNKFQNDIVTSRMTNGDEEATTSEEAVVDIPPAPSASVADTKPAAVAATSSPSSGGFSLILLPTLLFKFAIVMIIKFATDVVVFPILWMYRLVRLAKRKTMRGVSKLFGKEALNGEKVNGVNGDSASSS